MENNKLFSEFPPISTQEWEAVIHEDLKGADYDKKLAWDTIEGFKIKPYYRAEDIQNLEYLNTNPDEFPYTRGFKKNNNVWDVRQDIESENILEINRLAVDAIQKGVTSLGLKVKEVKSPQDMKQLLQGVDLAKIKINFIAARSYLQILRLFIDEIKSQGIDSKQVAGSLNFDIFAYALKHGDFWGSEEVNYEETIKILEIVDAELPKFRAITVNGNIFHNAGGSIVQELAFTLSEANEYMASLTDKGVKPASIASNMVFSFATGSNYFLEIAKIRAARLLWAKIVEQYNPMCDCAYHPYIHTSSSRWNKSVFDAYVNMLRTTTEAMSSAIAGADSISVAPFDFTYKDCDDFSYRIARNQQILLKEESYLDKIADPSAGSYYIENLTNSIAQHAWELFKQIETKGGFAAVVKNGYLQSEIEKVAQQRDMDIAMRKTAILGTNQYPNLNEKMLDKITGEYSFGNKTISEGNIRILKQYRGSQAFENLRLATEKSEKAPKVFLFTFGNLAMRKARAGFATNFFAVAGYEIIDNPGFKTIEEGVSAALASKAEVIVICSSDEEYAEITIPICNALKGKVKNITLAGYPKDHIDSFKTAGVNEFIHVKTNALESLTNFQKQMGIL